jgi:hypothetical protein
LLGVHDGGWQGGPLLDFVEVVGFMERQQIYADGSYVSGQRFKQSGRMPWFQ